jgi:hypothetical protein
VNSDGSYTYTASLHPAHPDMADTFQYKVLNTLSAKETVPQVATLPDVDYPLIAHNANYGVNSAGFVTNNLLTNVTSPGTHTVFAVNGTTLIPGVNTFALAHGTLKVQQNGTFSYQFASPSALTETFQVTYTDGDQCQMVTKLVTISRSSLSGHVFVDFNNDGIQDGIDRGIGNVRMILYILSGNVWVAKAVTYTNAAGVYSFNGLGAGTYRIVCTNPTGFIPGKKSVGTVNGVRDGIDPTEAITNIVLPAGQRGINYNFAFRPSKMLFV